jgi:hypothetical protein
VVLGDGEPKQLKAVKAEARRARVTVTIVVDVVHVLEYLWRAARALFGESNKEAEGWVGNRLLALLSGRSGGQVAETIRWWAKRKTLDETAQASIDTTCDYLADRTRTRLMHYADALRDGLPIATGVIEGACRYLVKDRMDRTGARWSLTGAEAVLRLRAVRASGDFDAYWPLSPRTRNGPQPWLTLRRRPNPRPASATQTTPQEGQVTEIARDPVAAEEPHPIRMIFRLFDRLGSATQILLHMRCEGLLFPRSVDGKSTSELAWRPPAYRNIIAVLQNPFYAGAYAYGKSRVQTNLIDGSLRKTYGRRRPMEEWTVLARDHHEGYVTWESFERNRARLSQNSYCQRAGGTKAAQPERATGPRDTRRNRAPQGVAVCLPAAGARSETRSGRCGLATGLRTIAVGTTLCLVGSGRTPHGSQRAELPHWALASGPGVEAFVRPGM